MRSARSSSSIASKAGQSELSLTTRPPWPNLAWLVRVRVALVPPGLHRRICCVDRAPPLWLLVLRLRLRLLLLVVVLAAAPPPPFLMMDGPAQEQSHLVHRQA